MAHMRGVPQTMHSRCEFGSSLAGAEFGSMATAFLIDACLLALLAYPGTFWTLDALGL